MKRDERATFNPIADMVGISHEDAEDSQRRALSVEEMTWLLLTAHAEKAARFDMPAADRVLLYNFAYETGIRPKQIRALTAANVLLDSDPPAIVTAAQHVKRRRRHEQPITPRMVALLRPIVSTKMPEAQLFGTMPSPFVLARMMRETSPPPAPRGLRRPGRTRRSRSADSDRTFSPRRTTKVTGPTSTVSVTRTGRPWATAARVNRTLRPAYTTRRPRPRTAIRSGRRRLPASARQTRCPTCCPRCSG
jgi:integrase